MEITEVRIKLMEEPNDRLQAFCSITIDGAFVIRDLKIIQGSRGSFVAMPSRKLNDRCPRCGGKNELRAGYCSGCGNKLNQERALRDQSGRAKLYADIAHPINTECREMIQEKVLQAFEEELVKAREPGYICRYDDYGESNFAEEETAAEAKPAAPATHTPSERQPEHQPDQTPKPAVDQTLARRIEPAETNETRPHHTAQNDRPEQLHTGEEASDSFGAGIE